MIATVHHPIVRAEAPVTGVALSSRPGSTVGVSAGGISIPGNRIGEIQISKTRSQSIAIRNRLQLIAIDLGRQRRFGPEEWLPDMDSNHDKQIQRLLCYHYTIGQPEPKPRTYQQPFLSQAQPCRNLSN